MTTIETDIPFDDDSPFEFDVEPEPIVPDVDAEPESFSERLLRMQNDSTGAGKKAAPRRGRSSKSNPPVSTKGVFVGPLTAIYAGIGTAIMPFDPVCATVVLQSAEACASSLDQLADQNQSVKKALESLLKTGAWGAVIAAHAPLVVMVMAHHSPAGDKLAPVASMLTGLQFESNDSES